MNDGALAEGMAADFLLSKGLTLIARNYRCRGGELDIVAREGQTFVFVEVRLRTNNDFGGAGASITAAKRRRMSLAARHFMSRLGHEPVCRFDAVLMDALSADRIEWLRNIDTE